MPKDGYLSHAEMKQVLADGGSVRFQKRIISKVEDLPTPAEVAALTGSTEDMKTSLEDIQKQREALDKQEAQLREAQDAAKGADAAGEEGAAKPPATGGSTPAPTTKGTTPTPAPGDKSGK